MNEENICFNDYKKSLRKYNRISVEDIVVSIYKELWIALYLFSVIETIDTLDFKGFTKLADKFGQVYLNENGSQKHISEFVNSNIEEIFRYKNDSDYNEHILFHEFFRGKQKELSINLAKGYIIQRLKGVGKQIEQFQTFVEYSTNWLKKHPKEIEKEIEREKEIIATYKDLSE